jgi:integrase/recombinase XerD
MGRYLEGKKLPSCIQPREPFRPRTPKLAVISKQTIDPPLALRGDAGANDPVFASRKGGGHLIERGVHAMVKRAAARAGINEDVSPHWLRHAHASMRSTGGASLPEVQETLGHGNIATTSGLPTRSACQLQRGLRLDEGVFLR